MVTVKLFFLIAETSQNNNNLEDSVWYPFWPQLLQEQQELQLPPDVGRNLKQRVNKNSSAVTLLVVTLPP